MFNARNNSVIGSEDEFRLLPGGGRTFAKRGERGGDFALRADFQVDVATLEHTAGEVGLAGPSFPLGAQALERGFLVSEGCEEIEGKILRIERQFREP
jgi:hypothetical protein